VPCTGGQIPPLEKKGGHLCPSRLTDHDSRLRKNIIYQKSVKKSVEKRMGGRGAISEKRKEGREVQ
jgi:hypothetical protein